MVRDKKITLSFFIITAILILISVVLNCIFPELIWIICNAFSIVLWTTSFTIYAKFLDRMKVYQLRYEQSLIEIEKERYDKDLNIYNRDNFIYYGNKRIKYMSPHKTYWLTTIKVSNLAILTDFCGIDQSILTMRILSQKISNFKSKYYMLVGRTAIDSVSFLVDGDIDIVKEISSVVKDYNMPNFKLKYSVNTCEVVDKNINIHNYINNCVRACNNNIFIYKEELSKKDYKAQVVINEMANAFSHNDFKLYLQPKINSATNKLIGAEALVRWGDIMPSEFIPIFEKNGYIKELDKYIWRKALDYLKWRKDNGLVLFPISVNVSRAFMDEDKLIDQINELISNYDIDKKYLELEITESTFCENDKMQKMIGTLKEGGYKLLMDDFGSGYSSLNVLKDIDFDVLKLDMKFFSASNDKSEKIIKTILDLSKSINVDVIAEGVETFEQVEMLKKMNCYYVQGYFYSKPLSIDDFNKFCSSQNYI